jgi:ribosomal protein S27AE
MTCPCCGASALYIEHLKHGMRLDGKTVLRRFFCGRCGWVFGMDDEGEYIRLGPSQHARPVPVTVEAL